MIAENFLKHQRTFVLSKQFCYKNIFKFKQIEDQVSVHFFWLKSIMTENCIHRTVYFTSVKSLGINLSWATVEAKFSGWFKRFPQKILGIYISKLNVQYEIEWHTSTGFLKSIANHNGRFRNLERFWDLWRRGKIMKIKSKHLLPIF